MPLGKLVLLRCCHFYHDLDIINKSTEICPHNISKYSGIFGNLCVQMCTVEYMLSITTISVGYAIKGSLSIISFSWSLYNRHTYFLFPCEHITVFLATIIWNNPLIFSSSLPCKVPVWILLAGGKYTLIFVQLLTTWTLFGQKTWFAHQYVN